MQAKLILVILRQIYAEVLRDLLVKAVESTETEWDDQLLIVCDRLLDYRSK